MQIPLLCERGETACVWGCMLIVEDMNFTALSGISRVSLKQLYLTTDMVGMTYHPHWRRGRVKRRIGEIENRKRPERTGALPPAVLWVFFTSPPIFRAQLPDESVKPEVLVFSN